MLKRTNKSKEQISNEIKQKEKTKRQIILAKLLFPFMSNLKSIYDAQTALLATSGYMQAALEKKLSLFKISDLEVDINDEPEGDIKTTMLNFIGQLEGENAQDSIELLETYGKILAKYGEKEYLKNPMNILKVNDLIKDE